MQGEEHCTDSLLGCCNHSSEPPESNSNVLSADTVAEIGDSWARVEWEEGAGAGAAWDRRARTAERRDTAGGDVLAVVFPVAHNDNRAEPRDNVLEKEGTPGAGVEGTPGDETNNRAGVLDDSHAAWMGAEDNCLLPDVHRAKARERAAAGRGKERERAAGTVKRVSES